MEPAEGIDYICPNCSQPVRIVPAPEAQLFTCPTCENGFIVAGEDGSTDLPASPSREKSTDHSDELDGIRIHRLSQAKRAANRAASMCFIGVMFCLVAAIQMGIHAARDILSGQNNWRTGVYSLIAIALMILAVVLFRKARDLRAESRRSTPTLPGNNIPG